MAEPEQLEYAPAARWRRRRRWPWVLLVASLVVGSAAWRYGPRAWETAKVLAFERRCLTYGRPADFPVYSELPDDVRGFPGQNPQPPGGHYQLWPGGRGVSLVYFTPDVWARHPLLKWEPGPAFLHARRTPGGETRLVGVDLSPIDDTLTFYPRVVVPAGWSAPSRGINNRFSLAMRLSLDDRVRVFAGQPDPNDPSHFTIDYAVNGTPGTIDGWLLDDNTAELHPRAGRHTLTDIGDPAWIPPGSHRRPEPDHGLVVPHAKP